MRGAEGWARGTKGWARGAKGWAVGLVLHACTSAPPARAPESAPESAPELVATAPGTALPDTPIAVAPAAPAPDTSLALAVYRAAGIPDVAQPWNASDYERCLQAFAELLRGGRADLPRSGSPRSGALFARIVDARHFELATGTTPAARARTLHAYLAVFPGFLKVYSPASDGIDFSVEQVELGVALLALLQSALDASRVFSQQEPSWAEPYEQQKLMTRGVVGGLGAMLLEEDRYPPPLRQRLRAELDRRGPQLARHLDGGSSVLR